MIHRYHNGHWVPGDARRDGSQPFPRYPAEGLYFSDVTGHIGSSPEAVTDTLASLAMKQGALADWLPAMPDWAGLMRRIREAFTAAERQGGLIASAVVGANGAPQTVCFPTCDEAVAREAAALALALLRANGQMDFLRLQPWFANGQRRVRVRIDAQLGRQRDRLEFHKDADGHILFNNLLFRSDAALLATEWSFDLQPMAAARAAALRQAWPAGLPSGIEQARATLRTAHPAPRIEGGVLPADGAVSWVEELVWHATPVAARRPVLQRTEVLAVLNTAAWSPDVAEVLVQIAETPGSGLARWLAGQNQVAQGLTEPVMRALWQQVHSGPDAAPLQALLQADAAAIDWSRRPGATAALVVDTTPTGAKEPSAQWQSSGMLGRPRSNSEQLDPLKAGVNTDQPRDFLRISVLLADPS